MGRILLPSIEVMNEVHTISINILIHSTHVRTSVQCTDVLLTDIFPSRNFRSQFTAVHTRTGTVYRTSTDRLIGGCDWMFDVLNMGFNGSSGFMGTVFCLHARVQ